MAATADEPRPGVAALLDRLGEVGGPPLREVPLDRARRDFEDLPVHRTDDPTSVASVRDATVPGDDGDLSARVYRPASRRHTTTTPGWSTARRTGSGSGRCRPPASCWATSPPTAGRRARFEVDAE